MHYIERGITKKLHLLHPVAERQEKMTTTAFRDRNRTISTKNYQEWLEDHRLLVEMTEAEGFTRDQAVEMVKAYYLYAIESNMGW